MKISVRRFPVRAGHDNGGSLKQHELQWNTKSIAKAKWPAFSSGQALSLTYVTRCHRKDHALHCQMPQKVVNAPYPLIDADPHFTRVVRYMRPSDYTTWVGATALGPTIFYLWGMRIQLCYLFETQQDVVSARNRGSD
jgi:hypothetical protein